MVCLLLWGLTWPVELSFVVPPDEFDHWQRIIAGFEADHPRIRITPVTEDYTTDERKAIYTADFQTEVAQYDLVYMDIIWTPEFANELVDLRPWVERDRLDLTGFLPSELAAGSVNDTLYRLPMRADVGVLYYRQDWVTQANQALGQPASALPATPNDLINLTNKMREQSSQIDSGYLWQGRSYEGLIAGFVEVMHGFGATWIKADDADQTIPQVGIDESATITAAQLLQNLIEQGISPLIVTDYTERASLNAFLQGQAAFLRGWPYFWSEIQRTYPNDQVAIALPFSFTDKPSVGCRGGWGFGIPQNAAHQKEAWEAIQYFMSEAVQKDFVLASGFLPSRQSLFRDPDIVANYPQMPQMLDYLEQSSVFRPAIAQYSAASEILQTALGQILRNQQSATSALQQAQTETEALLRS